AAQRLQGAPYALSDAIDAGTRTAARVQDVKTSAYTELGSESDRHAAPDLGLVLPAVEHVYLGLVQQLRAALRLQETETCRRQAEQEPGPQPSRAEAERESSDISRCGQKALVTKSAEICQRGGRRRLEDVPVGILFNVIESANRPRRGRNLVADLNQAVVRNL